jgi:hypothetical protein
VNRLDTGQTCPVFSGHHANCHNALDYAKIWVGVKQNKIGMILAVAAPFNLYTVIQIR